MTKVLDLVLSWRVAVRFTRYGESHNSPNMVRVTIQSDIYFDDYVIRDQVHYMFSTSFPRERADVPSQRFFNSSSHRHHFLRKHDSTFNGYAGC